MTLWLSVAVIGGLLSLVALPGLAQTLPSAVQPQNPSASSSVAISPIQPSSAPTSGLPANVITPATTNRLEPATGAPGRAPVFVGAGRGLPGMPGGPALNGALGASDPTARYMRPPTVGPLLCDPAVDVAC